jgi:hypothetical protein
MRADSGANDPVVERLRALGRPPVPASASARHLATMAATPARRPGPGPLVVLAAAAAALVLVAGGAWIVGRDGSDPTRVTLTDGSAPSGPTAEAPVADPADDDPARDPQDREAPGDTGAQPRPSTTTTDGLTPPGQTTAPSTTPSTAAPCGAGPPPFAGGDPGPPDGGGDGDADRQDESDAWEGARPPCPGGTTDEGTSPVDPFPDDPCRGPPPKAPGCVDPPTEGPNKVPREG